MATTVACSSASIHSPAADEGDYSFDAAAALLCSKPGRTLDNYTYGDESDDEDDDDNIQPDNIPTELMSPAQKLFHVNFSSLYTPNFFTNFTQKLKGASNWDDMISRFHFNPRYRITPLKGTIVNILFTVAKNAQDTLESSPTYAGCFARSIKMTISKFLPTTAYRLMDILECGTPDGHDPRTGHAVNGAPSNGKKNLLVHTCPHVSYRVSRCWSTGVLWHRVRLLGLVSYQQTAIEFGCRQLYTSQEN